MLPSEAAFLPLHAVPATLEPDRVAIIQGDERWTWDAFDTRSRQWAALLARSGVGKDDLVAFALPNSPEFLALVFGIYRAGAIPAPLSPKLSPGEVADIIDVMKPAAVIGEHPGFGGAALLPPDPDFRGEAPVPQIASAWKACTSGGSTGRPKVIVDGRPAGFAAGTEFIGIPSLETVLVPGPLYHNAPFSAAVFALWRGSTVVIMPRFDAEQALRLIERHYISWSMMVPTMMHRILQLPSAILESLDLSSWKMVVHTAAPMAEHSKRAWIERFGSEHIWEVYGATEGLVRTWIGGTEWLEKPRSVGKPIGGARIRILDEEGRDLPSGEIGEIFAMPAGGPQTSYRYIGAERRGTLDGWESVGDFGCLDDEGYLFLADRRTDLIITGGVNVWPAEVEAAILQHPAIRSCAVIGLPNEDLGAEVHAVIETLDETLTIEDMRDFLRDRLSPEKLPRSLTLTADAVRDDAGKVRKSQWQANLRSAA